MTNAEKIMAAALGGAAVGLIAGILVAPDKGSNTRKRIADQSKKMADGVKDAVNSGTETFSSIKEKLFGKAENQPAAESYSESGQW